MKKDGRGSLCEKLSKMQTSALLDELEAIIDDEKFDPERVAETLDILDERVPICADLDPEAELKKFMSDNSELFEVTEAPAAAVSPGKRIKLFSRMPPQLRAAGLALFVLIGLFGVLSGTYAVAYRLGVPLAVEIHERVFKLTPTGVEDEYNADASRFRAMQSALDANNVPDAVAIKWVPAGFTSKGATVSQTDDLIYFSEPFEDKDGNRVILFRVTYTPPWKYHDERTDTEGPAIEESEAGERYVVDGIEHLITENLGQARVVWENGSSLCSINGDISIEELKRMIYSIYE